MFPNITSDQNAERLPRRPSPELSLPVELAYERTTEVDSAVDELNKAVQASAANDASKTAIQNEMGYFV